MSGLLEIYLITKLVNLMTIPWTDLPAYKLGIIDKNGKQLKKTHQLQTSQEKVAYTTFHKFAFNLRRLIERLPGGKSSLLKYFTVYQLFKEETNPINEAFVDEFGDINKLFEEHLHETATLNRGRYEILHNTLDDSGNIVYKGDVVIAEETLRPAGVLFGSEVFAVTHENTKGQVLVSYEDLQTA